MALGGLRMAASGSVSALRSAASLAGTSTSGAAAAADAAGARQNSQPAEAGRLGGGFASPRDGSSGLAGQIRRGTQIKDAAHVAGHTLKEGDKGGHSSGPKLGEE
jgi:type IV secretion system protein TrbL